MFSMFKNLVGSKMLTKEDLGPVLDKMKEHLVCKILLSHITQTRLCNIL